MLHPNYLNAMTTFILINNFLAKKVTPKYGNLRFTNNSPVAQLTAKNKVERNKTSIT
jgi:hypothetical protein